MTDGPHRVRWFDSDRPVDGGTVYRRPPPDPSETEADLTPPKADE